jgi:DNA helicase-2/ATP-dependent DNA helicase PcrA
MSIHAAKGLEFPVVFLAGAEEEIFSGAWSVMRDAQHGKIENFSNKNEPRITNHASRIEEERRLFYVAMTRAKERLFITHCEDRILFGEKYQARSVKFMDEIPKEFVDLRIIKQENKKARKQENVPQLQLF